MNHAVFEQIQDYVVGNIDAQQALTMDAYELESAVVGLVGDIVQNDQLLLNYAEQLEISQQIVDDMVKLGPLQVLIDDPQISDIMVNGAEQIYIERQGRLERSDIKFRNSDHVLNMAQRIANSVSRRVDESSPMVDARLADGSRVNIIIPPLSLSGTCISIRKFTRNKMRLADYASTGGMSKAMSTLLGLATQARLNMLISGGTGTGKTTLLNALSAHISHDERVITIEDAAELQLSQPHVVRLEARTEGLEGSGEISQRQLLINALRMRPDRIILGEVRGAEAFDMLQAMNTGHDGSLSTLHANSPTDALARLEDMLAMGPKSQNGGLHARHIARAVDWLVQIERGSDGQRRISHISEVHFANGQSSIRDLYKYQLHSAGHAEFIQCNKIEKGVEKFIKRDLFKAMQGLFADAN